MQLKTPSSSSNKSSTTQKALGSQSVENGEHKSFWSTIILIEHDGALASQTIQARIFCISLFSSVMKSLLCAKYLLQQNKNFDCTF